MKKIIIRVSMLVTLGALLSACATPEQIAANKLQHYEVRCYRERGYPDLTAQDGCTERDIFNGSQIQAQWNAEAAQEAAREAAFEAQNERLTEAGIRAYSRIDRAFAPRAPRAPSAPLNCTTTYIGTQADTNCN